MQPPLRNPPNEERHSTNNTNTVDLWIFRNEVRSTEIRYASSIPSLIRYRFSVMGAIVDYMFTRRSSFLSSTLEHRKCFSFSSLNSAGLKSNAPFALQDSNLNMKDLRKVLHIYTKIIAKDIVQEELPSNDRACPQTTTSKSSKKRFYSTLFYHQLASL